MNSGLKANVIDLDKKVGDERVNPSENSRVPN